LHLLSPPLLCLLKNIYLEAACLLPIHAASYSGVRIARARKLPRFIYPCKTRGAAPVIGLKGLF